MKLQTHICLTMGLAFVIACLLAADLATAQGFPMQPPLMPNGRLARAGGNFFILGGVRYRNINQFEFNVKGHDLRQENPGTVPFGPDSEGDFGRGTGIPGFVDVGSAPDPANIIFYDNGELNPNSPGTRRSQCDDPDAGIVDCGEPDTSFPDPPNPQLGRFLVLDNQANCCGGQVFPYNVGKFVINDPLSQVSNPESIAETDTVTFERVIEDSAIYVADGLLLEDIEFADKVWTPFIELGFQYTNFFSLYYGISWFGLQHGMQKVNNTVGEFRRRVLIDTFPFSSSHGVAWPETQFDSSDTIVNLDANQSYAIWPNSIGKDIYPSRRFEERRNAARPNEQFVETITHRTDFEIYENRFGARSWQPLYGLGSVGAYGGFLFAPITFKTAGTRRTISNGPELEPGTIIEDLAAQKQGTMWAYGAFVGADVRFNYGGFFVGSQTEYRLVTTQKVELLDVETTLDTGGFSVAFDGGIQF